MTARPLTYGSVCSGIEAASVAWHPLGWRCAFVSEIDRHASAVLRHRYPTTPNHGDFTTIQPTDANRVDLLVGGTPCQSFSVAGLRKGLADDRGNLALEFLRLADRLSAPWVLWENVPGVLSSNGGRDFGAFLGGLAELGYGFAYRVLDAQHFGVPQRRRRVFVVGRLGDWRRAAAVLFEREGLSGHPPPSREAGEVVAGALEASSGQRRMCGLDEAGAGDLLPLTAPTLEAQGASTGQELAREGAVIPIQNDAFGSRSGEASDGRGHPGLGNAQPGSPMYTIDATRPHGVAHSLRPGTHAEHAEGISVPRAARDYKDPILAFRHSASAHDNGVPQEGKAPSLRATDSPVLSVALPGKTCQGDRCIPDDDVWPTLPAQGANNGGGAGAILHRPQAMAVRRLTPRECERLQGFPDDWTSLGDYDDGKGAVEISDTQRYKMCGNSMAVPVMSWLGRRVQLIDGMTTPEAR